MLYILRFTRYGLVARLGGHGLFTRSKNLCVPFLTNGLEPAKAAGSCALAAVRGVHSYAELLVVPSRSREKVRTRLRARKRFFPKNVRRGFDYSPRRATSRQASHAAGGSPWRTVPKEVFF